MASSNPVWRIFHVGSIFLGFCFFFKCFTSVWKRSNFGWLRSFPAFLAGFFISRIFFFFFFFKDFLKISDGFSPNSGRIPQNWRPFCRRIFHKYLQMFPGILKDFFSNGCLSLHFHKCWKSKNWFSLAVFIFFSNFLTRFDEDSSAVDLDFFAVLFRPFLPFLLQYKVGKKFAVQNSKRERNCSLQYKVFNF